MDAASSTFVPISPLPPEISVRDFAALPAPVEANVSVDSPEPAPPAAMDVDGGATVPAGAPPSPPPENHETEQAVRSPPRESPTHEAADDGPATAITSVRMCVVCRTNAGKYKCPRCLESYCSVPCSTAHKTNHPPPTEHETEPTATGAPPNATTVSSEPAKPSTLPTPSTSASADPTGGLSNPFSVLDNSRALDRLFAQYPQLSRQLQNIHAATQPPASSPEHHRSDGGPTSRPFPSRRGPGHHQQHGGGGGSRRPAAWNREEGLRKGRAALKAARNRPGQDGEGVREFAELVKLLIAGGVEGEGGVVRPPGHKQSDATEAEELIRQGMVDQNLELIRQLMAAEKV